MARSERAAGLIPFIIMLVLFLAAVGWGYLNYSAITKSGDGLEAKLAARTAERDLLKEQNALLADQLRKTADLIGFPGSGEYASELNPNIKVQQFVDLDALKGLGQIVKKQMQDVRIEFRDSGFDIPQGKMAQIDSSPGAGIIVRYIDPPKQPELLKWSELPGMYLLAMMDMKDHLESFQTQLKNARNAVDEARGATTQVQTDKDREIADLRQRMQDTNQNLESRISDLRDTKTRLEDRLQTAEEEKAAVVEESEQKEQEYKNRILALEGSLRRLKVQIEIDRAPTPDGQVLAASSSTGVAVINRGKQDNLKPGTVFQAYNFSKGNVKRMKGVLKVLDVFDASAKCAIVEMNPADPIVEGDLIENTLYNPGKTLHFYILGNLRKYGTSEAKMVLERLGNKVDDQIDVLTDYVILGEKENPTDSELMDTPEYKKAVELGVKIITEKELEAFTKY